MVRCVCDTKSAGDIADGDITAAASFLWKRGQISCDVRKDQTGGVAFLFIKQKNKNQLAKT